MKNIFKTSYYALCVLILSTIITVHPDQLSADVGVAPDMYQMPGGYPPPGASPYGPGAYPAPGAPGYGPGGPGNMPPLSDGDIRQLEQLDQEIKKFVEQMPPEQKAEFDNQVLVMQEKMSKMNEHELVKFMEDTFREAGLIEPGAQPPAPTPEAQPTMPEPIPQFEEPAQEEVVVEKTKPKRQIEDAQAMLEEIIQLTDKVILRASTVQTIAFQVKKWAQQDLLKSWDSTNDWNLLKHSIEKFKQKLHNIKTDKHLGDLIDDTELYEKLESVQTVLKEQEPKFELSELFSADRMSNDSKDALQTILNSFIQILFVESIMPALARLEEKYEPKAKKLREEEEKLSKTAFEGSKKSATAAPVSVGGFPEQEGYQGPAGQPVPQGYPYYPTDYGNYGGQWPNNQPAATDAGQSNAGRGHGGHGGSGNQKEKDKKDKEEQLKEEEFKRSINEIDEIFEDIDEAIEGSPSFKNLRSHVENGSQRYDKQLLKRIAEVTPKLRTASRKAKSFVKKLKDSPGLKKKQYDELMKLLKEHPLIGQVAGQIRSIEKSNRISADKKYAYFGGQNEQAALGINKNIKAEIGEPADLVALLKEFENFTKTVNELNK